MSEVRKNGKREVEMMGERWKAVVESLIDMAATVIA
jgi:hypothetical protein